MSDINRCIRCGAIISPGENPCRYCGANQIPVNVNIPLFRRNQINLQKPFSLYTIMAICILVFIIMTLTGGTTNPYNLIRFGAKFNPFITAGQYYRLLTSAFIHIGIMHLVFNMYGLYLYGSLVEKLYGRFGMAFLFCSSAIIGSLSSYAFNESISAGASGGLFGLIGALLYFYQREPFKAKHIFGRSLFIILAINLYYGLSTSGIDNFAHVGGLIMGYFVAFMYGLISEERDNTKVILSIALVILTIIALTMIAVSSKL